jgi:hypothetical protein
VAINDNADLTEDDKRANLRALFKWMRSMIYRQSECSDHCGEFDERIVPVDFFIDLHFATIAYLNMRV